VILRHIAYLVGDVQAAEDLAQETFMKLYDAPPLHDNIIAWLSRVASNLSYNYLRGEKVKRNKAPAIMEHETDNVISIEDIALRNHEVTQTKKVLNKLNARDRMCLLLKFSGYKYAEIAEITGLDRNSVGTVLARAQAKFKEAYLKGVKVL
jgi:RNA polymerase sigma factor (sigma-70 family)